ncbi:hypothetical protein IFM89_015117 [Coptis chinensis]|uniref:NADP-dependent oxidoreductase domain-containing protein n=1 Tax=Coptis chinensis TaxID=261450 RepID=A0A835MEJ5_9MAGN|nr:hypothetical protein IFM89_015117 [Coptis chinensis]
MKLGSQGLEVSRQGLGCMGMSAFYGPAKPESDMIELIHHAIDTAITFLDTSDVYGPFTNEILLGKALKDIRNKVKLATKFGLHFADGKISIRGDPVYVRAACEASLKRFMSNPGLNRNAIVAGVSKDITIADLEHAPSHCLQWKDFLTKPVDDDVVCEDGAPPLVVQLTWLANGEGAAIGVGTSHCLMDGIGTAQFLNSFADLVSGRREPDNFQPKSVWDRHLLDPTQMSLHTRNLEFNLIPDISGFFATFGSETMSPTSVVFYKTRLTKLKKLASLTGQHSELPFSFTSFEEKPWRSLHTPAPVLVIHTGVEDEGDEFPSRMGVAVYTLENNLEFKNCVGAIDLRTEKFAAFEASPWESEIQLRTLSLLGDELSAVDNRLVGHILLWVMKDYGVKESWTKKYVIRKETNEPLSYFDILRIMRSGSILFHGHRTQGYYDTIKEEFKHVAIHGIPSRTRPYSESLEGVLHVGSLISPRSLVLQQHK